MQGHVAIVNLHMKNIIIGADAMSISILHVNQVIMMANILLDISNCSPV